MPKYRAENERSWHTWLTIKRNISLHTPKNYNPCNPLPKGKSGGYVDRFGNEWVEGPYHGDPKLPYKREWDVQLIKTGEGKWNIRGGATKSNKGGYYINVRPDGMKSH